MTQTVLITGCSTGIGKELAFAMLNAGYKVYATARSPDKIEDLALKGAHPLQLDVTCEDSIANAIKQIETEGDQVQILVNNAGYGAMGPLAEMPPDEVETQFKTNVFGPLYLVQHCLPHMRKSGSGVIINIGSVSGILVTPFSAAYCATKAALHALSDGLRMELAPFNIRVITVQPGAIKSEFGNNAESSLTRTFSEQSIYWEIKDSVLKRARASQNNPTSSATLVKALLNELQKQHPAAIMRVGNGSRAFPLIARWVPLAVRDKMLSKTFGLLPWRPANISRSQECE